MVEEKKGILVNCSIVSVRLSFVAMPGGFTNVSALQKLINVIHVILMKK